MAHGHGGQPELDLPFPSLRSRDAGDRVTVTSAQGTCGCHLSSYIVRLNLSVSIHMALVISLPSYNDANLRCETRLAGSRRGIAMRFSPVW